MIKKEWKINNIKKTKPLIERLLSIRGIKTPQEIEEFLNPLSITLLHPNAFCDMEKATDRIKKAIEEKENILIYGDFDADGVTSTSLLYKTLKYLDANVDYFIPTRETEGHGLNKAALIKNFTKFKPKLIITVDCGISNADEVAIIKTFGTDIIITDHHEAPETLPNAYAIINPKAPFSLNENLSTRDIKSLSALAGVGVVFKLAQGLLEKFDKITFSENLLPFVAIGTIADVVPLIYENRYYVIKGLDLISKGKHYGIKRLLEASGYNNIEAGITAEQIGFGVAPRINACGRLDSVKAAVDLLTSDNNQQIELAITELENYNKLRKELCNETFKQASAMAKNSNDNLIVLYNKDWHVGIIGIVASMLTDTYGKPSFLMTYTPDTNLIRCSARGIEGCEDINLYEIISQMGDKLDGFGGHSLAAGLYFNPDKISFEKIKAELISIYNNYTNSKKLLPVLNIDLELDETEITEDLINTIKTLEPFGASNPTPTFAVKDFTLLQKKMIGSSSNHLKLKVKKNNSEFDALWWSHQDINIPPQKNLDMAFYPQINTFNGNTNIQLIIKDIHSEFLQEEQENTIITHDNRHKTDIDDKVNNYLKTITKDFCIFAESNNIIENLKKYPEIHKRIVNRLTLKNTNGIMFYDCPPTDEIMNEIISKVSPRIIHYMNYDIQNSTQFDYIKTMSGMIKYTCNHKNGEFYIAKSACYMGITNEMVEILLDLFEECKGIKINERTDEIYTITLQNQVSENQIKQGENYSLFLARLDEVTNYRTTYLECKI